MCYSVIAKQKANIRDKYVRFYPLIKTQMLLFHTLVSDVCFCLATERSYAFFVRGSGCALFHFSTNFFQTSFYSFSCNSPTPKNYPRKNAQIKKAPL